MVEPTKDDKADKPAKVQLSQATKDKEPDTSATTPSASVLAQGEGGSAAAAAEGTEESKRT